MMNVLIVRKRAYFSDLTPRAVRFSARLDEAKRTTPFRRSLSLCQPNKDIQIRR